MGIEPEALLLGIGLDEGDLLFLAAGEAEIIERLVVDAEEAAGRAIFGRHIGKRRAVGQCQRREARAIIFDEAADHAMLAQHLRGSEHQIGCGDALGKAPGELEADDLGNEHGDRLAEHGRLGLDAAHAPAEHAQAVDHRRVAVGADAGVGIGDFHAVGVDAGPDGLGDVLEIDLMADAGAGGTA